MSKKQLVVMLFDSQGKPPPAEFAHEYAWVGDANGGTYIRAVTKSYPAENKRKGIQSPFTAAMDDWDKHARKGEGCTNTVPAMKDGPRKEARLRPAIEKALRALSAVGEYDHLVGRFPDQIDCAEDILSAALNESHSPRVLITVSGGVADYVADPGIEIAVVDYDNAEVDEDYKIVLAPRWRSLVAPTDAAAFVEYQESGDEPTKFINYYKCPACGHEWEDQWSATCEDDCPKCGKRHITPYESEDV